MKSRLFTKDVIQAQISDHQPVLNDGVLFWNIMMQGRQRHNGGFNNGFGMVESDQDYTQRLAKVAHTIVEIVANNPAIKVVSMCEGPIKVGHMAVMMEVFKRAPVMQRFISQATEEFSRPNVAGFHHWGLLMLADNKYDITPVGIDGLEQLVQYPKLANRIHLWRLSHADETKYVGLAHFPYGGDVHHAHKKSFSKAGNVYRKLIKSLFKQYAEKDFTFCADFNFNPYLIGKWQSHAMDIVPANNSILLTKGKPQQQNKILEVTVDGILLSNLCKRKLFGLHAHTGLFARIKAEYNLARKFTQREWLDSDVNDKALVLVL